MLYTSILFVCTNYLLNNVSDTWVLLPLHKKSSVRQIMKIHLDIVTHSSKYSKQDENPTRVSHSYVWNARLPTNQAAQRAKHGLCLGRGVGAGHAIHVSHVHAGAKQAAWNSSKVYQDSSKFKKKLLLKLCIEVTILLCTSIEVTIEIHAGLQQAP